MTIAVLLLKKKKSHKFAFMVVLGLALLKEVFDSFSLTASFEEAAKDILITMIFPIFIWMVSKLKKRIDSY
jgi:hypothetical protein